MECAGSTSNINMHTNILRAALPRRSAGLALRLAGHPGFANSPTLISCRYLSTANGAPSLQSNRVGDKPGAEGLHQRMPQSLYLVLPVLS